jgi:2-keto-4-pentenoate hydratase/2-oxohepta-3-ene-1,7-dioic acid hydratase in catechol pathway
MNYAGHNKEMHNALELSEPVIFMKPDSSLLKDGKPFFIPGFSSDVHYETEIVVKIDKLGKNIAERFASRYYNEITVGIDFTARDLQSRLRRQGLPWEISKAFDSSAAIGAFIPLRQAGDINKVPFCLHINGQKVQKGNTADMLFPVDKIIAYASRFFTLKMGDLIYTGTPSGVGPVQIDDHLEGYIGETKLLDFYVK